MHSAARQPLVKTHDDVIPCQKYGTGERLMERLLNPTGGLTLKRCPSLVNVRDRHNRAVY